MLKNKKAVSSRRLCKFKKGDRLQVMTGRHASKVGSLLEILPDKRQALVEGVNVMIKHAKANKETGEMGGRVRKNGPVPLSNVSLICPKCMQPSRVGFEFGPPAQEGGKRVKHRVCRRCKARIDD
ncbi:MAG: 50S ribosomal protein L24 [Deltaproteobacteria bacterium]|jgi:large subunit ribosomal protein L24|nr:50S ribosomal protein L24 [Deltaproteobacteria bacterium]